MYIRLALGFPSREIKSGEYFPTMIPGYPIIRREHAKSVPSRHPLYLLTYVLMILFLELQRGFF
jgi:hypothetical protein